MDILLRHIQPSGVNMPPPVREAFIRSFLNEAADDWNGRSITLTHQPDLVFQKASHILQDEGFSIGQGPDATSGILRATYSRRYDRNEDFLATVEGSFGSKLDLEFKVELHETMPNNYSLQSSRRLPSWLDAFERRLRDDLATVKETYTEAHTVEVDVTLGPGERLRSAFSGTLLDYSGCATYDEVRDLRKEYGDGKALPLGVYAFDPKPSLAAPDMLLHVGRFGPKPMEFNGTLIVAPQNSGKTRLILRWALAANDAGYNLFIVDVKGNLLPQLLEGGLRGEVHFLSTDDGGDENVTQRGSTFNILEELDPTTFRGRAEIKSICEALIPRFGGDDERFWPIRVRWLRAIICLRKLFDRYFKTVSDLGDIYDLVTTEARFYQCIEDVRRAEAFQKQENPNVKLPVPNCEFWINEAATLIRQDHPTIAGGQRESQYTYATLTIHLATALGPFYRYGVMYGRTSGRSDFRLSDLDGERQMTIILAAREHDGEDAQTVSAMVLKRLEQILKRRFDVEQPDHPILLLLDETRRIKGFSPGKYVTFAREAKAGCVLVYQSIEQIENEKEIKEVLENVGIQIYLRSVTGSTADRLTAMLPTRFRPQYTQGLSTGAGFSKSSQVSQGEVPCLSKAELYKLPAGDFPALVFIKDHNAGRPFLVDMSEDRLERLTEEINHG